MLEKLFRGYAKLVKQLKILVKNPQMLTNYLALLTQHQVVQLGQKITILQMAVHHYVILVHYLAGDKNATKPEKL